MEKCLSTPSSQQLKSKPYPGQERLERPVDYKAIIEAGREWEDPDFMIGEFALLDTTMPAHIEASEWRRFQWRRASDVYGNFFLYEDIIPTDIV